MRLLGLVFKSDNIIKSKAMKLIVKNILPHFKSQWKLIVSVVKKSTENENSSVRKPK